VALLFGCNCRRSIFETPISAAPPWNFRRGQTYKLPLRRRVARFCMRVDRLTEDAE
jgi:hypothetical protein